MNLSNKLFRCSSLAEVLSPAKSKGEVLSQGAKNYIRAQVKKDLYGIEGFSGSKYTHKGIDLEDLAIERAGAIRFKEYTKNELYAENSLICGTADIIDLDPKIIIDTKCTWQVETHPFFKDEAMEKAKKAGYDVQLNGYMMIYGEMFGIEFDHAEIDFTLFPVPTNLIGSFDNYSDLTEKINAIPLEKRTTTIIIERDPVIIDKIRTIIPHAQRYYKMLQLELTDYE